MIYSDLDCNYSSELKSHIESEYGTDTNAYIDEGNCYFSAWMEIYLENGKYYLRQRYFWNGDTNSTTTSSYITNTKTTTTTSNKSITSYITDQKTTTTSTKPITLSTTTTSMPTPTNIYGISIIINQSDPTNDGVIDAKDSAVILTDFANVLIGEKTTLDISKADANGDGKVDAKDAALILVYFANKMLD